MLMRESQGGGIALAAKAGLETAWRIIDPGVHDPAVSSGLVAGQARFLFQHPDRTARITFEELHCRGKSDDTAANDHNVSIRIHRASSSIFEYAALPHQLAIQRWVLLERARPWSQK